MREQFKAIPNPLQKQILIRLSGCGIGIAALLILLVNGGRWQLFFPAVIITLYFLNSTIHLFYRCAEGRYVELRGTCQSIERSVVRKRIKALHIESDGRFIKLIPHQNSGSVREGDSLIIYLADNASVYEVDHELVLCDIITYGKDRCLHESKPNL